MKNKNIDGYYYCAGVIFLAIVYHLAVRLGLLMANFQPNTSAVWPPTGIAIAVLLLFGNKYWPGIALGIFLGYILKTNSLSVSIGIAIGNTFEALTAVYLLKRFINFHNSLDRIQDVIGLAVFGALATTCSASIGVITLVLTGNVILPDIGTVWYTWWIGDFLGALVITPMLLVWYTNWPLRWNSRKYLEAGVLIVSILIVTGYVFLIQQASGITHEALIYVIFPFVIYAALRMTQIGAVSTVFLVSGIATVGTVVGTGPFVRKTLNDSLILLQTFMGVVSLIAMTLAAATNQRQKTEVLLHQKIDDLDRLNGASQTFLGIFNTQTTYQAICELAVEQFGATYAWICLSTGEENQTLAFYGLSQELVDLINSQINNHPILDSEFGGLRSELKIKDRQGKGLSYLALPLTFAGKKFGDLRLVSREKDFFTDDRKIIFKSYTNLGAVAIQNTWLFDQVKNGNEQLHALSHRLMEVQEAERLHLSRELHDESGQIMSAMMVQLGLLERDAKEPELIRQHASELKRIAAEVLNNLHEMAVNLRPSSLDHLGLVTSLDQYIRDFSSQHNLNIQFETVGLSEKRLPIDVETALFRIVQESLTNVILHAQASRVGVLLSQHSGKLITLIEDNGVGFTPDKVAEQSHLGLFGMRERIEMLGGNLIVESSVGKGTTILVEVPYEN